MIKKNTILICLLLATVQGFCQRSSDFYGSPYQLRNSGSYGRHSSLMSFGYGLGTVQSYKDIETNLYGLRDNSWRHIGTFYFKYEHALMQEVGIGVNASFIHFWWQDPYYNQVLDDHQETMQYNRVNIGLMAFYHFNKFIPTEKLDAYLGLGFDGSFRRLSYGDDGINSTRFITAFKAGLRLYLNPSVSIYGEIGHNEMSVANLGITISLGRKNLSRKKASSNDNSQSSKDGIDKDAADSTNKNPDVHKAE